MTEENETEGRRRISPAERARIVELHEMGYAARRIARSIRRDRKSVQRVLEEEGCVPKPTETSAPSTEAKLDRFHERIAEMVAKSLTVTRMLRELKEAGYRGGRTILADYVREIRPPRVSSRPVKRRFETDPGREMQIDWSPYSIPIGGEKRIVHALGVTLCHSRKLHVRFYPDERQSTLLEGLALAAEDFDGVAKRWVVDNMATAVLGRIGRETSREVLWNQRFADFVTHYGAEAFACEVADPDRKGKGERPFYYMERDFVQASSFESFAALNAAVRRWLDTVANCRPHGTTGLRPDDVWKSERDFLIRLPEQRFAVHDEEPRQVGMDATVSVRGRRYTVPARLAWQTATVRLFAEHFEVVDRMGAVALRREYADRDDPRRLFIDPRHYDGLPRGPRGAPGAARRLEEALVERFPALAELIEGIKRRMKSIAPIHLRALWGLVDLYGEAAFVDAASRAQKHRRHSAESVRRILEQDHPLPPAEPLPPPIGGESARTLALLSEVDPGSLDDYGHLDDAEARSESAEIEDVVDGEPDRDA